MTGLSQRLERSCFGWLIEPCLTMFPFGKYKIKICPGDLVQCSRNFADELGLPFPRLQTLAEVAVARGSGKNQQNSATERCMRHRIKEVRSQKFPKRSVSTVSALASCDFWGNRSDSENFMEFLIGLIGTTVFVSRFFPPGFFCLERKLGGDHCNFVADYEIFLSRCRDYFDSTHSSFQFQLRCMENQ